VFVVGFAIIRRRDCAGGGNAEFHAERWRLDPELWCIALDLSSDAIGLMTDMA
jgi:hypothetical protein